MGKIKCPSGGKRTDLGKGTANGPCDHCDVWISLPHKWKKKI